MKFFFGIAAFISFAAPALAQTTPPPPPAGITFSTSTTTVLVPALVRTKQGQLVYTLKADDFTLTDNGTPQKLTLDPDTDTQPLALVIIVENGGYGRQELEKLQNLGNFLDALVGGVRHRVAIVSFDSMPHIEQPFVTNMNTISAAMRNIDAGDSGAAILDALDFSVDLLRKQPDNYRRAILLFSETVDRGSHDTLSQALRAITDTNTTIYALGFSTPRNELRHQSGKSVADSTPGPRGGCMAAPQNADPHASEADNNTNPGLRAFHCLGLLVPPIRLAEIATLSALETMRRNTPEAVSRLTGGEYYRVENINTVTRDLMTISNHVPNRYILSFSPQDPAPGPHALNLQLKNYANLIVNARSTYWADSAAPDALTDPTNVTDPATSIPAPGTTPTPQK